MFMEIYENYSLKEFNTFGLDVRAEYFVFTRNNDDVIEAADFSRKKNLPLYIIGEGSNILFLNDINGVFIHPSGNSVEIMEENEKEVTVSAESGVKWDDLVDFTTSKDYWGLENLSGIPGTAGAAPVQNIGAYGTELENVLKYLEGINLSTGGEVKFENRECNFGYRTSIFKESLKNKIFISKIVLTLSAAPNPNLSYRGIAEKIGKRDKHEICSKEISRVIREIRNEKLPDIRKSGNAGSFFKNPVISSENFERLKSGYGDLKYYNLESGNIKIPAAWLLEKAGFKGKIIGRTGFYKHQPLVLVNYGGATGAELLTTSQMAIKAVREKFGIELEPEVNILK